MDTLTLTPKPESSWLSLDRGLVFATSLIVVFVGLVLNLVLNLALPVQANPITTPNAEVTLISEVQSIKAGQTFRVALRWRMRPDWHIYWQNPGDSGAKPTLKWQLPKGFSAGEMQFPYPERFLIPPIPLANFGYGGEVYFPVDVQAPAQLGQEPVTLKVKADWLICEQECIPEAGELSLTLPVGDGSVTRDKALLFQQIGRRIPQEKFPIDFQVTDRQLILDLSKLTGIGADQQVVFFPYQGGLIENAGTQVLVAVNDRLFLQLPRGDQPQVTSIDGVLVIGGTRSVILASQGVVSAPEQTPASAQTTGFGEAVLLAVLGGIVLNLMPCVLPILSLRALSIASLSQQSPSLVRWRGLAFGGGVLTCFGAIAVALLGLRALGQQIGWGFQLQSPVIVLSLAYLLLSVGLNLSGVFVIGGGWMGLGQKLTARSGLAGEFFTGVLATLMSTPCTAPFMATAISAALVLPALEGGLVLLALGVGFALPYVGLCFAPALQRMLPKPGAWLEILPQVLAFPIYGTAAWLLWVFTLQAGTDGLAIGLGGAVLIGFSGWLYGKTQVARQIWRRIGTIGTALTLVVVLLLLPLVANPSTASIWSAYSGERLETLRRSNQPVFINFTAAWCVSCLINERTTLSKPEVQQAFAQRQVAMLKADWTNRDGAITEKLEKFGSSGVPLYVLYGKDPEPVILPKDLSPEVIYEYLDRVVPAS